MDYLEDLLNEEGSPDQSENKITNVEVEKKNDCEHAELYRSICLICDESIDTTKRHMYREYALLGRGRDLLIKADHAQHYIQK